MDHVYLIGSYIKILLLTSFFASSLACAKMILNPWYSCDVIIFQNKKKLSILVNF